MNIIFWHFCSLICCKSKEATLFQCPTSVLVVDSIISLDALWNSLVTGHHRILVSCSVARLDRDYHRRSDGSCCGGSGGCSSCQLCRCSYQCRMNGWRQVSRRTGATWRVAGDLGDDAWWRHAHRRWRRWRRWRVWGMRRVVVVVMATRRSRRLWRSGLQGPRWRGRRCRQEWSWVWGRVLVDPGMSQNVFSRQPGTEIKQSALAYFLKTRGQLNKSATFLIKIFGVYIHLSSGSFLNRHLMRHFALEEIESGMLNWPRRILANKPVCSWPWNGYLKAKESINSSEKNVDLKWSIISRTFLDTFAKIQLHWS